GHRDSIREVADAPALVEGVICGAGNGRAGGGGVSSAKVAIGLIDDAVRSYIRFPSRVHGKRYCCLCRVISYLIRKVALIAIDIVSRHSKVVKPGLIKPRDGGGGGVTYINARAIVLARITIVDLVAGKFGAGNGIPSQAQRSRGGHRREHKVQQTEYPQTRSQCDSRSRVRRYQHGEKREATLGQS